MSRLDIAFVVPSLVRGGAERVTVNLANGLAERGDRIRILVTGTDVPLASSLSPSVEMVLLGRPRVRHALRPLLRVLRSEPPNIVFSTHADVNLALCAISPRFRAETHLVLREPTYAPVELGGRSTRFARSAQRLLYRRAAHVVASNNVLARDLAELTNAPVTRLENPVDVDGIRRLAEASCAENVSDSSLERGRRFVSVGRLHAQKSMDELILAFASGACDNDQLTIVGDGPERSALEQLILDKNLGHRVHLPGHRDNPWAEVAVADVLVLASRNEGTPNAVLEALALGTPALATSDLVVLEDLAREVGPEGLLLVPRAAFPSALATVPRRTGPYPRPSLLPERFALTGAVDAFYGVLHRLPEPSRSGQQTEQD